MGSCCCIFCVFPELFWVELVPPCFVIVEVVRRRDGFDLGFYDFMSYHVLWYAGSSFVWFFSSVKRFLFCLWSVLIAWEDLSLDLWGFR